MKNSVELRKEELKKKIGEYGIFHDKCLLEK
jgi:hypothetical protein